MNRVSPAWGEAPDARRKPFILLCNEVVAAGKGDGTDAICLH